MFSNWFGLTGNRLYDQRIGKRERRFVKLCRKTPDWTRHCAANSAAVSGQEMNHWLFLNPSSLFREHLDRMEDKTASWLIGTWFTLGLAAVTMVGESPVQDDADWEHYQNLLRSADPDSDVVLKRAVPAYHLQFGSRDLYQQLLAELKKRIGIELNLEHSMTFGILLAQMLEKAHERYVKSINR